MRLRTFNAPDMKLAMQMIREALGDDAIIISSSRAINGNGIVVTAAAEPVSDVEAPKPPHITPPVISFLQARAFTADHVLEQIEEVLRFHSTPPDVIAKLIETAK